MFNGEELTSRCIGTHSDLYTTPPSCIAYSHIALSNYCHVSLDGGLMGLGIEIKSTVVCMVSSAFSMRSLISGVTRCTERKVNTDRQLLTQPLHPALHTVRVGRHLTSGQGLSLAGSVSGLK